MCRIDQGNATAQGTAVASSENLEKIRNAIRNKYAEVSISATGKFQYPTGKDGVDELRYNPTIIKSATHNLLESFCGVGNPFSLGKIKHGDVVLDFGSGAG